MSTLPYANKNLGQHFLKDQNVILKITQDFKDFEGGILEIGPGPAILTAELAKHQKNFHVIEMDQRFLEYLEKHLEKDHIHFTDAVKVDLNQFIKDQFNDQNIWLVSNLPYNVGSVLLVNFLTVEKIKRMTLMFQKEVADKVFPFTTTKNTLNSLMVLCQNYFECSLLLKVPPGAFSPPPKVDSAVISFKRIENPLVPISEFKNLETFVRLVFSQKRKQLHGILKQRFPEEKIVEAFSQLNLTMTIRAEAMSFHQMIDLYRKFYP